MDKEEPCEKSSLPKLPPKSRFNDEESTAVLRLLLKQERFLKDKDNPALTLTPGKTSKQLPPVSRDHEGTNDERGMMRENILPVASHQGCSSSLRYLDPLPGRKAATDGTGSEEGNFRSAKLAKAKESQKESYRRQLQSTPHKRISVSSPLIDKHTERRKTMLKIFRIMIINCSPF